MEIEELERAASTYGTPVYVFDEREFTKRVENVRSLLPSGVQLCFAMKANPFMVACASRAVECIEACSPGEVLIASAAGVDLSSIVVSGIVKDEAFIRDLIENNAGASRFTCESESQFFMLERIARTSNARIDVLLRLNSGNQFGMDASTVKSLIGDCRESSVVRIKGIQFFSGTQKTSRRIVREVCKLDRFIEDVYRTCDVQIEELEYGPGLPIEYFESDERKAADAESEPVEALAQVLSDMAFSGRVTLEIGRYLAAACGSYVTEIMEVKHAAEQNFAIVDGGMHQITYYGRAMAMKQPPCEPLLEREASESKLWTVCGSLCTTNDILVKQLPLGAAQAGDRLVFHKAGAYCMTEGLSLFLSRNLPRIVICDCDSQMRLIREWVETAQLNSAYALQMR